MLKPLYNEEVVVSVSFWQQIRTISNSKVLEIDLEVVEKFDDFVVFDANSVQFPKVFVICSITLNEKTSYALHFFEENVAAFCFKNTKIFLLSTSVLSNPCLHFEAFWIQNDSKGSTRIERLFQSAFREIFADFGSNRTAKSRKSQSIADFWQFQWILLRLENCQMKAPNSSRWLN